jgi:hypothetical protein
MRGFKRACATRGAAAILAAFLGWSLSAAPASAVVRIDIDLSKQRMVVADKRGAKFVWPISSGRRGYVTPRGQFRPTVLRRMHYSRKYDNAPMPHSIFFRGGYAIHGTNAVGQLGRPASHGCVRLAPGAAARLFAMVQRDGARIRITGSPPHMRRADAAEASPHAQLALDAVEGGITQVARGREREASGAIESAQASPPRVVLLAPGALVAFDAQAAFDLLEIVSGDDLEDLEADAQAPDEDIPAPARPAGDDLAGWALRGRD